MPQVKPAAELIDAIRESGLVRPRSTGVTMISGGPDSALLLAGLAEVVGPDNLDAVHINYRLRPESDRDEEVCRDLCGRLRVDLRVERPTLRSGNLQAEARRARYEAAERIRARYGADWIATGHTGTDLAETVLYRLARSPGRRALLGMAPRRGRLIRPLLALGREQVRALAEAAALPFVDDPSNLDPRFARNRIRTEVLPVLRSIDADAERNIAMTRRELAEEADALEAIAAAAIPGGEAAAPVEALADLHPAIRRIALRILAERAAGSAVPLGIDRATEVWRVARRPEGGIVELPGSVRAVCESGWIVFAAGSYGERPWPAVTLEVPGRCRWGGWEVTAEVRPGRPRRAEGPDVAMLDADLLGPSLTVRGWREGDHIEPLGLEGSKSLQDLFTDRRVPRSHRRLIPVVARGDEVVWVAGVAIAEPYKVGAGTSATTVISAGPARGRGSE